MNQAVAASCLPMALALALLSARATAQPAGAEPPAVGVVRAAQEQITQSDEFVGRVQAVNRVALVARVTGFLEKRLFVEGTEVNKGDLLYVVEQPPFQAQVNAAKANIEQFKAQHRNAQVSLQRAQALLPTSAGQQSNVDAAQASEGALAAQIAGAEAQLETAAINLAYTAMYAPIDGKISATQVTEGNVVSPTSGTLAEIVSQDPIYVLFPISVRAGLDLRSEYGPKGGFSAVVVKIRLPNGQIYGSDGKVDYVSPTVAENTDTLTVRAVLPNPRAFSATEPVPRELFDGEFVTVLLQGVQPISVLSIPRAAVLSDQEGDYVYVVSGQNKAQVRRIQQGQSTPSTAVITNGLSDGELVISEGLQSVHDGETVSPGPATPGPRLDSRPDAPRKPTAPASGAPADRQ